MQKHLQATLQPYFTQQYYVMAVTTAKKLRKMHLPEFQGPSDKPSNVLPKINI
jgi:hypothetical protein